MIRAALLLLLVASPLRAACGKPDPIFTKPLRLTAEFHSCRLQIKTIDARLTLTALNMLRGQSKEQAKAALQDQGFACNKTLCKLLVKRKETLFDKWFGLNTARRKLYRWEQTSYQIGFTSDRILTAGDLRADFRSEVAMLPFGKRPKPSDYRVSYD